MNASTAPVSSVIRKPIASDALGDLIGFINYGVVSGIIACIGIFTNVANITTFVRLGFNETVNVSLTVLAVVDLANILCLLLGSVFYARVLCDLICDVVNEDGFTYIVGGVPRSFFVTLAGFITSMVAFERCLCVLKPLEVKTIFNKKKLIIVLSGLFIVTSITYAPLFYTVNLGWVLNPKTNRSWLTVVERPHSYEINALVFRVIVIYSLITYVVVFVCTVMIVWRISSQSKWRSRRTKDTSPASSRDKEDKPEVGQTPTKTSLSGRDRRATRTVILIATMYIVCFFPETCLILTMSAVPEFNNGMFYKNIFDITWSIAFVLEGVCSCSNIVVYLNTSTKFKEAFLSTFAISRWIKK